MRLAVIGLGRMGRALADRLLEKDHEVSVWNRTPGRSYRAPSARSQGDALFGPTTGASWPRGISGGGS